MEKNVVKAWLVAGGFEEDTRKNSPSRLLSTKFSFSLHKRFTAPTK